jgi:hypothetical protein
MPNLILIYQPQSPANITNYLHQIWHSTKFQYHQKTRDKLGRVHFTTTSMTVAFKYGVIYHTPLTFRIYLIYLQCTFHIKRARHTSALTILSLIIQETSTEYYAYMDVLKNGDPPTRRICHDSTHICPQYNAVQAAQSMSYSRPAQPVARLATLCSRHSVCYFARGDIQYDESSFNSYPGKVEIHRQSIFEQP